MIFCIDIGNSNIVYGCFDRDRLVFSSRAATDSRRMSDQYAVELRAVLEIHGVRPEDVTDAIVSSVVPGVTTSVADAAETVFGLSPQLLTPSCYKNLEIRLDNPRELGCDLLATAVAAKAKYPLPLIVIDMGTATKLTVISHDGAFLGGAILPGLRIATEALVANTSLLPGVSFKAPLHTIGSNTTDCMMSGAVFGTASLLDGMFERMCVELGECATAVITGGLADIVAPHCTMPLIRDSELLLGGLRIICETDSQPRTK
ncbi:MAG: type III pantothenate kinase [Oscillospiraceae bacterium]